MRLRDRLSVLVVEDDADYAALLATLLRREGCSATVAPDGYYALQRLSADKPDLIVLDLRLPVLDGYELLAEIRAHYPKMPIVVVSGAEDAKRRGLESGADAVLAKPLDINDFLGTVGSVVARH